MGDLELSFSKAWLDPVPYSVGFASQITTDGTHWGDWLDSNDSVFQVTFP
jgi:hypothetical protein